MAWFRRSSRFIILATILAVALILGLGDNVSGQVQTPSSSASLSSKLENAFRPPRSPGAPAPDNTTGGATRQGKDEELGRCIQGSRSLVALVPTSGIGETTSEFPTIFWYMPQTAALALEFVLRDANVKDIYRVQYSLPKSTQGVVSPPGVRGLNVSNLSPLEIGQEYHWELALICNPSDRSKDIVVEGWVKRVKADPTLARRIQQTTPQERVALYADARLWYETLATLVELRRTRPDDQELIDAWETLLKSVGLEIVASEPIVSS